MGQFNSNIMCHVCLEMFEYLTREYLKKIKKISVHFICNIDYRV